jgi:hypothetical protein
MLVYRDDGEPIDPARAWASIRAQAFALEVSASHDAVTAFLIELGEVESAIVDALFPERDGRDPLAAALRDASLAAGRLFGASSAGRPGGALVSALKRALDRVPDSRLPSRATRRVSEGYAYYALHPEAYAAAALRFVEDVRPAFTVCIGIRSIGASLSAVVAAVVEREGADVSLWSVRPRGHPFDRHLRLDADLERAILDAPLGAQYVVVDEGPGLSGSSFAAVADALAGIPASALSFFPSWNADGSTFLSDGARQRWHRHRRWAAESPGRRAGLDALSRGARSIDLSAGAWRSVLGGDHEGGPPVQPQHERVKSWLPDRREIVRFAGLGRYGERARHRAMDLANAGLCAPPGRLCGGYLALPFVEGTQCTPEDADDGLLAAIARHVAIVQRTFRSPRTPGFDDLCHMIETNVSESGAAAVLPRLERFRRAIEDCPAAAIDARMLTHEWLRTPDGFVKVDALDHAHDHFFPGAQDAAWDLAACEAEFALAPDAMDHLLHRYDAASGDGDVRERLDFFRIAYAAFQVGYAALASQSLRGSDDARRFVRRRELFVRRLRDLLSA